MTDGIELISTEHPRGGFWLRLRNFFRLGLRKSSLEAFEVELPDVLSIDEAFARLDPEEIPPEGLTVPELERRVFKRSVYGPG